MALRRVSTFSDLFARYPSLSHLTFIHYLGGMERLDRFSYWDASFRRTQSISTPTKSDPKISFKASKDGAGETLSIKGLTF